MGSRIDFVPYPPTSFPFRDLLVLEQLPLGSGDSVCEIGIGSGGTTARLARICGSVVGFEISTQTVDVLRYLEERHKNLRLVVADSTDPAQVGPFEGQFTRAIACDTLEHVNDPAAFFRTLGRLLAPGGQFLVTFPNEPKAKMHGITRFDTPKELEAIVTEGGLTDVRLGAAKLQAPAERVAERLGWGPLKMVRKVVKRVKGNGEAPAEHAHPHEDPPQTFEQTNFMKGIKTWQKLAPAVNLYWFGVLRLMERSGPAFSIDWDFKQTDFTDCQVFITGRKPSTPPGKA